MSRPNSDSSGHETRQAYSFTDSNWVPGVPFTVRLLPTGQFIYSAPSLETETLLEVTPDELTAMINERRIPFVETDEAAFWESVSNSARDLTPWRREVHIRGVRTGRDIWTRVHAVPRLEPNGDITWTGLIVEVTDLKDAEHRLRNAYQRLSSHMEHTPLVVLEWDSRFQIVRWSETAERVFGYSAGEVVGKNVFEINLIHPDEAPRILALMTEMIECRTSRSRSLNRNVAKDGRVLTCEWYNSVVYDEEGKAVTILSLGLDATERQKAVDGLARSESLLRTAIEAARMLVWEWDLLAGRLYYSGDYASFFGLPHGLDYGLQSFALQAVHPDDLPALMNAYVDYFKQTGEFRHEFRGATRAPDGGERWFACRGQVEHTPDGQPSRVLAVTFDVTSRKRAEQEKEIFDHQLQEAQKLETLGVLAGGIAHDFNNLLTVVLGNASLSRKSMAENAPGQEYLNQIEAACQRAASLCQQMLAYAGRGQVALERVDVNKVIRDTAALLRLSADSRVRIELNLPDSLPPVTADQPQLRQVLLNLVMNATEALEPGGCVFVRTGTLTVKSDDTMAGFQPPPSRGDFVFMDVADNGPGMADQVRSRIFEPFFTTKFPGRGLGLSAVLGIVRAHRGAIRVDTAQGRGTLVRVLWPSAAYDAPKPPIVPAPPPRTPLEAPRRETGLALVVDDEMFVREVAASSLEEMGFETLVAAGGEAALELFKQNAGTLRTAVIDLVMPGLNGAELLGKIREIAPTFPVVIVSGYTDHGLNGSAPGVGKTLFVQKPFLPEELMNAVREVLDGK